MPYHRRECNVLVAEHLDPTSTLRIPGFKHSPISVARLATGPERPAAVHDLTGHGAA